MFRSISECLDVTPLQRFRGSRRALVAAVGICAACGPAEEVDGSPDFGAGPPAFMGTLNPNNPNAAPPNPNANPNAPANNPNPSVVDPNTTNNPEVNPNPNAPIDNGQTANTNNGTGGASQDPYTDPNGQAGSSMGQAGSQTIDPVDPPPVDPEEPPVVNPPDPPLPPDPPPPPTEPAATPAEIAAYFAGLPCGAKYNAMGDGGWQFCLRLADGGGACARGSAAFTRATFQGGAAVTGVAQISGVLETQVGVVTTAGALHLGPVGGISTTPRIASGVINFSGGYHAAAALVERGNGLGVVSWTDNAAPADVALPAGVQPIQVSANYGIACALSTTGDAYCWTAGGNHDLPLTATPSRIALREPVKQISVGQNSICGVTFGDELECFAAWYSSPFLPTEGAAPNFNVRRTSFPEIRDIHNGFNQGVVVRGDGAAFYLPGGRTPPSDNPGVQFTGVTDAIAAGGDRGSACVQTGAGAVFCMIGGTTTTRATLGGAPLEARAAGCPR
jgi:hypothetical protein